MIKGYFFQDGRAYLSCWLHLPRLDITDLIDFHVDTGAARTCIHPRATQRLQIPYGQLNSGSLVTLGGVGGSSSYFSEPASLILVDEREDKFFVVNVNIDLLIAVPTAGNSGLPPLLGRDVLNNWGMYSELRADRLEFYP